MQLPTSNQLADWKTYGKQVRKVLDKEKKDHARTKKALKKMEAENQNLRTEVGRLSEKASASEMEGPTAPLVRDLNKEQKETVLHAVKQKYFRYCPLMDRGLFDSTNVLVPMGRLLGINDDELPAYTQSIRKTVVEKTIYRRDYFQGRLRNAYLGEFTTMNKIVRQQMAGVATTF